VALLTILAPVPRLRRGGTYRPLAALALALAAILLETASQQPRLVYSRDDAPKNEAGHIVLLVDGSESVWRNRAMARKALGAFAESAAQLVREHAATDPSVHWSADLVRFGEGVETIWRKQPATSLAPLILPSEPDIPLSTSNAAPAIDLALENIRNAKGRGAILLFSDGNFDTPIPARLLRETQALGVPIYVFGYGAQVPGAGLVAADIGPEHRIGTPVTARGTVLGSGLLTAANGVDEVAVSVPENGVLTPVRSAIRFHARGLQYAWLKFDGTGFSQKRRLYTLVRGPSRVLAFGEAPWAKMLTPERWRVTQGDPEAPPLLSEYDVIVVDSLSPEDFAPGFDDQLLTASASTGLFLINGPMRGNEDTPQRISDWNASAISPILPVDSNPREFILDPPQRDVVIMIDVSGSMSNSLDRATVVASTLMDQLRPKDTIAILTFASTTGQRFSRRNATPQAIAHARQFLSTLQAGGGTNVNDTLREAASLRTNYCAYFFISDGSFNPPKISPLCFPTAISTSGKRFANGVVTWQDHITVTNHAQAVNITFKFFEPEERTRFFRTGRFRPKSDLVEKIMTRADVNGIAIAYPRVDASVLSFHSNPPPDPALALRRDVANPGVATAVFLGEIPTSYAASPQDAVEVGEVLDRLTGWNRLDRFDISIALESERLKVAVTVLDDGEVDSALPDQLSGSVVSSKGIHNGLHFRPVGRRGQFIAETRFVPQEERSRGVLVLKEPGQPEQVIPLYLPPKDVISETGAQHETFAFGIDRAALDALAKGSGGGWLKGTGALYTPGHRSERTRDIHQWLIAIALISLAVSLWLQGRPT